LQVKAHTLRRVIEFCNYTIAQQDRDEADTRSVGLAPPHLPGVAADDTESVSRRRWESLFVNADMEQGDLCEMASAS